MNEIFKSSPNQIDLNFQEARFAKVSEEGGLVISGLPRSFQMVNSDGTGDPLLLLGKFGADVIHFPAGGGVGVHTHEGDHILIVLKGNGKVIYSGEGYNLEPGVCYMVPGAVEHAIVAVTDLVMIAVGNNHFPVESSERMTPKN